MDCLARMASHTHLAVGRLDASGASARMAYPCSVWPVISQQASPGFSHGVLSRVTVELPRLAGNWSLKLSNITSISLFFKIGCKTSPDSGGD